jgi:DNA-binding transcriptional regulator PaaX
VSLSWSAKQKILLLLMAGFTLSLSRSPRQHIRIIKSVPKAWREIERRALHRSIREFYSERLVDFVEKPDGTLEMILTENGKKRALRYKLEELEIKKPGRWDGKWRLVMFDIPEKRKRAREALREKLRELGFKELQKSVFVHPFECKDEIDFVTEVFALRPYVKLARSDYVTNQDELRVRFKLV